MNITWLEGALYTVIAAASPFIELLGSDKPLSSRAIICICIVSLVAGCNALKAFLSTSYSRASGDAILVRDPNAQPPRS